MVEEEEKEEEEEEEGDFGEEPGLGGGEGEGALRVVDDDDDDDDDDIGWRVGEGRDEGVLGVGVLVGMNLGVVVLGAALLVVEMRVDVETVVVVGKAVDFFVLVPIVVFAFFVVVFIVVVFIVGFVVGRVEDLETLREVEWNLVVESTVEVVGIVEVLGLVIGGTFVVTREVVRMLVVVVVRGGRGVVFTHIPEFLTP